MFIKIIKTKILSSIQKARSLSETLVLKIFAKLGFRITRYHGPTWSHDQSPDLLHSKVTPHATFSPWLNDIDFQECYSQMRSHTLVDIYRCYELWSIAKQMKNNDGCFVEVGVWRGGTGALLATISNATNIDREIFLADTFEGVVKASKFDTSYQDKEHSDTSLTIVTNLIKKMQLKNVSTLKGVFPEDTSQQINQSIALLHCDVDVYQSAKEIIEWALPKLSVGGVLVFDDYGFSGCEGVTRYVHELKDKYDLMFLHNLNGHAIFIK